MPRIDPGKASQITMLTMEIMRLEDEIADFAAPRKGEIKSLRIQIRKMIGEVDQPGLPFNGEGENNG